MVDCTYGINYGCNGGWPYKAMSWWKTHAAVKNSCYPYTAKDGNCKTSCAGVVKTTAAHYVSKGEDNLKASSNNRVTTVLVDASAFSSYGGGVYDGYCGTSLNHAVTLTGYGTEGGKDYWRIKNSWNTWWGESGYIRLAR